METLYKDTLTAQQAADVFLEHRQPTKLYLAVEYGVIDLTLDTDATIDAVLMGEAQQMPFPLLNELITPLQADALSVIFNVLQTKGGIHFNLERAYMHHGENKMLFYNDNPTLLLTVSRNPIKTKLNS